MGLRLSVIVGGDKDTHADQGDNFFVDNGDTDQFEDSRIKKDQTLVGSF